MDRIMATLILFVLGIFLGVALASSLSSTYIQQHYRDPMDDLGIERFQRCEINTTNCHSNWYEIVWKKEKQK